MAKFIYSALPQSLPQKGFDELNRLFGAGKKVGVYDLPIPQKGIEWLIDIGGLNEGGNNPSAIDITGLAQKEWYGMIATLLAWGTQKNIPIIRQKWREIDIDNDERSKFEFLGFEKVVGFAFKTEALLPQTPIAA